jgi:hypothetical protein
MKATLAVCVLMLAVPACFGADAVYVITNNNAPGNTATIYQLDAATGALTMIAVLETEGEGASNAIATNLQQAITQHAECIFVMDAGSDIASFSKATRYSKVGNYSNPSVVFGGTLALTPNGKFLYASYNASENIAAWAVNSDCSLSFIAAYVPSVGPQPLANIAVSPNGKYLVISVVGELFAIDQTKGILTDLGSLPRCCFFEGGIDFTKDSRIVVLGAIAGGQPGAVFAAMTPSGFGGANFLSLQNSMRLTGSVTPFFSAAGYAGSGNLYLGITGSGGSHPSAVFTAKFTENPPNATVANVTVVNAPPYYEDGTIAANGDLMLIPEFPNQIGVYSIDPDGSLSLLNTTIDERAGAMFSISVFPNTR